MPKLHITLCDAHGYPLPGAPTIPVQPPPSDDSFATDAPERAKAERVMLADAAALWGVTPEEATRRLRGERA